MPLTKSERQVLWASNTFTDVAAGGTATSDAVGISSSSSRLFLGIHCENLATTPAADAKVEIYVKSSIGDIDGDAVEDYETDLHAPLVAVIDVSSGGESPAVKVIPLDPGLKGFKLLAKNTGATDTIRVRSRLLEQVVT